MGYLRFLFKETAIFDTYFVVCVVLASVGEGVVIATIINSLTSKTAASIEIFDLVIFFAALFLFFWARRQLINRTCYELEQLIQNIRTRVCERVRGAELASFEAIGKTQIQQILAEDCQALYGAGRNVMHALAAVGLAGSALFFALTISGTVFLCLVLIIVVILHFFSLQQAASQREYDNATREDQRFFAVLTEELEGFKELRINDAKAKDLFDNDIIVSAERAKNMKFQIARRLNLNLVAGYVTFYVMLGFIMFALPMVWEQDASDVPASKIAATFLFIFSPLYDLAMGYSGLLQANLAVERISALETRLAKLTTEKSTAAQQTAEFQSLCCKQLTFQYPQLPSADESPFQVGPLDLTIQRGEIIFVIGGNGSGKSTLLHLLCGLRQPSSGELYVNDKGTPSSKGDCYRSYFSIILQDYHLFQRMLGLPYIDRERIDQLLVLLQLNGITDVDAEGRFTNLNLSGGQKKRLALLAMELDDRQLLLFDEWAADQDPDFRRFFYTVYLEELRARGKTVIAATHDDHYFHIADRVFRLDHGQLSEMDQSMFIHARASKGAPSDVLEQ